VTTVEYNVGARHATADEGAAGRRNTSAQGSFKNFARSRFVIGDKASVKEQIARYRELLGVDHFTMRCQWPELPQKRIRGSVQRLDEIFAS
jgi:alkanesulfonate monooxygenase SsuD/methylene tetrahydromethanopterin reductase-like flavin-dependent oxidoreductase (luciferase family)